MEAALTIKQTTKTDLIQSLSWQVEMGCDEVLLDDVSDRSSWQVSLAEITRSEITGSEITGPEITGPKIVAPETTGGQSKISEVVPAQQSSVARAETSQSAQPDSVSSAHDIVANITNVSALKEALAAFEGCELKRTASNLVFCDGNPEASVMIIGEAPGKDEDRMGVPFVGNAGQLLDQMLAAVGLDRSSVYIANIMPWRPPGNRTPTAEETAMMRPFVEKHIELVAPDIILALGGTAAKTLLETETGIMKLRGAFHDYQPRILPKTEKALPLLPCLHPGYLLRSPHHKSLAFQDLVRLRKKMANG
ncbi:MAG: uracil-DNA glycosylase [Candidatus Puniceispirillaceae bacterium]